MKQDAFCAALQSQVGTATSEVVRAKKAEDEAGDAYLRALSEKRDAQIGIDLAMQTGDAGAIATAQSIYAFSCGLVNERERDLNAAQQEHSRCFNHYKDLEFEFESKCR